MVWLVTGLAAAALFGSVLLEAHIAFTQSVSRSIRRGG